MLEAGLGLGFTITLHALVGEAVQDGATLVTDGAAGSEVVFHPGVGGPCLGRQQQIIELHRNFPPPVSPQ